MNRMKNKHEILKHKLIKRILKYSQIYSLADLSILSIEELIIIQERALIKLIILSEFRSRHSKH